jgi:hypothetical protein
MENVKEKYESILALVNELPNDHKNHYGFFCTEIDEKGITFTGSKNLVWWQETIFPIVQQAKNYGLKVESRYDVTRIYQAPTLYAY